jgi:hypothetical protein
MPNATLRSIEREVYRQAADKSASGFRRVWGRDKAI